MSGKGHEIPKQSSVGRKKSNRKGPTELSEDIKLTKRKGRIMKQGFRWRKAWTERVLEIDGLDIKYHAINRNGQVCVCASTPLSSPT